MLPYFHIPTIQLGPLTIHTWGLFVSLGFLVAIAVSYHKAKKYSLDTNRLLDLAFWIILGSFVGARIFHVLFYEPEVYLKQPIEILKIWQGGFSSFGGLLGGALAGGLYLKRKRLNFWQWADLIAFSLPLGWGIGRIGCFLTHQHPGFKSNFFLAVQMPNGPRLETALIESIFVFLVFLYFCLAHRRPHFSGFYLVNFVIIYGFGRFIIDFLRATDIPGADIRYWFLTPAQWGSLILILTGFYLFFRVKRIFQHS